MSETCHDIPEETLNDVMLQVAEERERRDWIDGTLLKRKIERMGKPQAYATNNKGSLEQVDFGVPVVMRDMVLEMIDEMQGR